MQDDLKDLYEAELKHLRTHAEEFGAREPFRRVAARLGLTPNVALRDPFVEWLLQGYAFLAARVRGQLEAEYPRFTQNLLSVVYPHLCAPTPSMIIADFAMKPDPGLMDSGALVPRETRLSMSVRDNNAASGKRTRRVTFTTGRAVRLWPIETREVRYLADAAAVAGAGASRSAPAAIALTLGLTAPDAELAAFGADDLDLFLADAEGGGSPLFEALVLGTQGCEMVAGGRPQAPVGVAPLGLDRTARTGSPDDAGVDAADALLPYGLRSFDGLRLLHEYFSLPSRFHFVRLTGLQRAMAGRSGRTLTVLFLLSRPFPELAGKLGREAVRPNCVPAVNLFRHSADDIPFTERRFEHQILPDRGDPTGYEVHSVLGLRGIATGGEERVFRPFFAADGFGARADRGRAYYHVSRRARQRPALRDERDGGLDAYVGSESWVSIVNEAGKPVEPGLKALSLDLLCTNRHLPVFAMVEVGGSQRLTCELDEGWREIRVVSGPSAPRSGLPEGRRLWDVISHLSLNHLSLIDGENASGEGQAGRAAGALRQLLRIYAPERDVEAHALIDGLVDVSARPAVRRIPPLYHRRGDMAAPMAFARGLEVALTFEDGARGAPVIAALLDRVLAGHADANSFVETVLRRADKRERARFAPRSGTRTVL